MIDTRQQKNASYARRFVQEAKSVAKWRHNHIVEIYDAGEEDGIYYYVMEYINGADLRHVLAVTADGLAALATGFALAFARELRAEGHRRSAMAAAVYALLLVFTWITLEVRRAFHGPVLGPALVELPGTLESARWFQALKLSPLDRADFLAATDKVTGEVTRIVVTVTVLK